MEKVNLRAKEKHTYDGRPLMPGDEYEASDKDAKVLTIIGKAEYVVREAKILTDDELTSLKKDWEAKYDNAPTYQTRAMTAEQPALLVKRRGRPRKQ